MFSLIAQKLPKQEDLAESVSGKTYQQVSSVSSAFLLGQTCWSGTRHLRPSKTC